MRTINTSTSLMYLLDGNTFKLFTYLFNVEDKEIKLSIKHLSINLNMDGKTIQKCIKTLEFFNIIKKESGLTTKECNVYTILTESIEMFDKLTTNELLNIKTTK